MNTSYRVVVNPLQGLSGILHIIGLWKILEDRGEKGWKAIIPLLSTLSFGKVCDENKKARRLVVYEILLFLAAIAFVIALSVGLYGYGSGSDIMIIDPSDINGLVISQHIADSMEPGAALAIIATAVLLAVFAITALVANIKLRLAFDRYNEGPSWMIVLWIFIPCLAMLYYAFYHKVVNSPLLINEADITEENY